MGQYPYMQRMLLSVALFLFAPTVALAGSPLGVWHVSRYYTPVEGQEQYYNGWARNEGQCATKNLYYIPYKGKSRGSYSAEACMNGQGDVFKTADGTDLRTAKAASLAACPPSYLGQTIHIQNIGYVRCADTGGAIHGKRIDLWAGIGDVGYHNLPTLPAGPLLVHLLEYGKTAKLDANPPLLVTRRTDAGRRP